MDVSKAFAMQIVNRDYLFEIPTDVACCPYCGSKLYAQCHVWQQANNGLWVADGIDIECETEPDLDSEAWENWFSTHSKTPYVYQLLVTKKIKEWINKNFRFED